MKGTFFYFFIYFFFFLQTLKVATKLAFYLKNIKFVVRRNSRWRYQISLKKLVKKICWINSESFGGTFKKRVLKKIKTFKGGKFKKGNFLLLNYALSFSFFFFFRKKSDWAWRIFFKKVTVKKYLLYSSQKSVFFKVKCKETCK